MTVVVDHDSGRLVWAAEGRNAATLRLFFDLLGEERCAAITHVSADAAAWIAKVVTERCPEAIRCADPFHVVAWATAAVDKVRRGAWNRARVKAMPRKRFGKRGRPRAGTGNTPDADREQATVVKKSRWALLKNPENLTEKQAVTLRLIELEDPALHRAYLLKESLRLILQMKHDDAVVELARWIGLARRCRIPEFVEFWCQRFRFACRVSGFGVADGGGDAGDRGAAVRPVGVFLVVARERGFDLADAGAGPSGRV
jgi:transposase